MALNFDKYSISSIDSITGFSLATKECLFILDEIKDATLEGAAETVWATGKEGRRLSALKRNKTCSISANNGYIVGGLLAETIGDKSPVEDFETASISMPMFERLEVGAGGTVNTTFEAIGEVGNEIGFIYKANKDGSQGKKYAQEATAGADSFSYTPADKEIELPTGGTFVEGDVVIVFYDYLTKGRKYSNKSDSYAGDVMIVADIMVKDVCDGTEQHSKLVMPKVTLDDNFSYSFGNDMAVQAFKAEAPASVCTKVGEREYFYWVFPEAE